MTQISLNPDGHNLLSFLATATASRYKEFRKAGKIARKAAEAVKYDLHREVLQCPGVVQFFLENYNGDRYYAESALERAVRAAVDFVSTHDVVLHDLVQEATITVHPSQLQAGTVAIALGTCNRIEKHGNKAVAKDLRMALLTKTLEAVLLKSDSPEVRLLVSVALGR